MKKLERKKTKWYNVIFTSLIELCFRNYSGSLLYNLWQNVNRRLHFLIFKTNLAQRSSILWWHKKKGGKIRGRISTINNFFLWAIKCWKCQHQKNIVTLVSPIVYCTWSAEPDNVCVVQCSVVEFVGMDQDQISLFHTLKLNSGLAWWINRNNRDINQDASL